MAEPSKSATLVRDRIIRSQCGIAAGTRIQVKESYKSIETIQPGDMVRVGIGPDRVQKVVWVGRRDVILSRKRINELPVRVRRDAIADGVPSRDLYLAPEHAIYLGGKLFMIGNLVNGRSIVRERSQRTASFWAIGLEHHNVIRAEDMWIESLLSDNAHTFGAVATLEQATEAAPPRPRTNLGTLLPTVMRAIDDVLATHGVRAEYAVPPDLSVNLDAESIRDMTEALLRHAATAAPYRQILITARQQPQGARITVVLEDGAHDAAWHLAGLRAVEARAAMDGGSLTVTVQPNEHATLNLFLRD